MAWIYLVESEELHTHCKIGSDQSPIAKSNPSAKVSSCKECKKEICPKHQFGMMLDPLNVRFPMGLLTLSQEDSPARTSVLQELEKVWKESEAVFSSKSCAWPKKSSPSSYSLKTFQPSQAEGDFESLEKLPRWGMIVDGVLYPLRGSELYTDVKDGSYWLTPSTMENLPVREGKALDRALHRGNSMSKRKCSGRLNEQVAYPQMWPTPTARDWKDNGEAPAELRRKSPCLPCRVKMIATPTASQMHKPVLEPCPSSKNGTHGETTQESIGRLNPEMIGKKLSPLFVELLMGYPTKWTDLNHSETL